MLNSTAHIKTKLICWLRRGAFTFFICAQSRPLAEAFRIARCAHSTHFSIINLASSAKSIKLQHSSLLYTSTFAFAYTYVHMYLLMHVYINVYLYTSLYSINLSFFFTRIAFLYGKIKKKSFATSIKVYAVSP